MACSNSKLFLFILIFILLFYSLFAFTRAPARGEDTLRPAGGMRYDEDKNNSKVFAVFTQALKVSLNEAFEIWKKIHQKITNYWKGYLLPKIQNRIKKEIKKREPVIKEQIQKEKEELKQEVKRYFSNTWEWIRNILGD